MLSVPNPPTVNDVLRAYLRALQGERTQESFSTALGVKRAALSHILTGTRKVSSEHLESLSRAYGIPPSRMMADVAKIALNMEMGRPPNEGIGGRWVGPDEASAASGEAEAPRRER